MLKPYKLINHSVNKFQIFLDYIFYEIWCNPYLDYNIDVFNSNKELFEIVEKYYNGDPNKDLLYLPTKKIFNHFKRLILKDANFLKNIKEKYKNNNDIQNLCNNTPGIKPITYDELDLIDKDLSKDLKHFCISLWDELFERKLIQEKVGTKKEYYDEFVRQNETLVCQCCGLSVIKQPMQLYREAFDHYLPKAKYPFNTINFKNLTPLCHDCNSEYKKEKDPIFSSGRRRKAFYNYMLEEYSISIIIHNFKINGSSNEIADFTIDIVSEECTEEVETWKNLFGITERYKARCLGYAKIWIRQFIKYKRMGINLEEYIDDLNDNLLCDGAFLKKPFIIACREENII